MKIAMWSGPRNLSTAMMYAFSARGDTVVWDEPFYAAYLEATGADHPMRAEILDMHEPDPDVIASTCKGPIPQGKRVFYQKHMTHHMIEGFDRRWMRSVTNVFLIRHPARVVASYAKKREGATLEDIGFPQQEQIFNEVADWSGHPPLVVDSDDIRADPAAVLARLCDRLGIRYTPKMLRWPAGGNEADGAWAPHWYGAVHRSTGFDGAEGALPALGGVYADLAANALPIYERLAESRI